MKKVRECFHMLITAVICLMVSMVPGKNVTAAIAERDIWQIDLHRALWIKCVVCG